jgi:carboxypeptidase Q
MMWLLCSALTALHAQKAKSKQSSPGPGTYLKDSAMIRAFFDEELKNGKCHDNLRILCKDYGKRVSGSVIAAGAVEWSYKLMQQYGFDTVYKQEVMVPRWERGGKEFATGWYENSYGGKSAGLYGFNICALGGSVGTGEEGVKGQVVEVKNFEELKALGTEKIKGKIVFFNRPMDDSRINTFNAYGGAVNQRGRGASEAAKYGAVCVVVRSMSLGINDYPHTGAMWYADSSNKIPACAISTMDAEELSKMIRENDIMMLEIRMQCQTLADTLSHNVIAEIRGSEKPDEIIVVGGHLDAWDMAEGAHDDGSGVMQALEALRLFRQLRIRPKRTIRCVFYMNEENGMKGALKYAEIAKAKKEKHIAALESDEGGFTPRGFAFDASGDTLKRIMAWSKLFEPYYMERFVTGGGGTDISPLKAQGAVLLDLNPDSQRYFDFHHAATDRFEAVNKRELELGAAGIAGMLYLLSEYGL